MFDFKDILQIEKPAVGTATAWEVTRTWPNGPEVRRFVTRLAAEQHLAQLLDVPLHRIGN